MCLLTLAIMNTCDRQDLRELGGYQECTGEGLGLGPGLAHL